MKERENIREEERGRERERGGDLPQAMKRRKINDAFCSLIVASFEKIFGFNVTP